ncbi:MAG: GIY-YIG nuclease family protein [Clostridia bacterium]|nr:GIY-YIG nuclease family protein [Clostridia bacterium]
MYFIYILRCADGSLYTGITTDVERRLREHISKNGKGAKYTRGKTALGMECIFKTEDRQSASKLEYWTKKLTKAQKEKLISDSDLSVLQGKIELEKYVYYGKKMS